MRQSKERTRGDAASRNRNNTNSPTTLCVRILFVSLIVGCLIQIAQNALYFFPGCDNLYYTDVDEDVDADGRRSSNLRPHEHTYNRDYYNHNHHHHHNNNHHKPLPKIAIATIYRKEQERIDTTITDKARCAQYGVRELPQSKKHKKRIFFGSMLANENTEVIAAHAIEVYNKYDVVALVESNTTHSGVPRDMFYGPGSLNERILTESEMFGTIDKTKVVVDYWLEDMPNLYDMAREVEQRNTIWKIWVDQGMTEYDIGIMADLDEIVSRDFLNALQVCDFPETRFHPKERPTCQAPKMILSSIQFEGSPLCINELEWYHPDLILGSCVAGVGDPSGRVIPERTDQKSHGSRHSKTLGHRTDEWGMTDIHSYPKDVVENNRFPLWDGRDIREVSGSEKDLMNFADKENLGMGTTAVFGAAYHLHNWFQDTQVLRHKYFTYGHADEHALTLKLSDFHGDVNLMVRCARGLGNNIKVREEGDPNNVNYYENNTVLPEGSDSIFSFGGNRPIFFVNRTYVEERHALVQRMIAADEAKHGTIYNESKSEWRTK